MLRVCNAKDHTSETDLKQNNDPHQTLGPVRKK